MNKLAWMHPACCNFRKEFYKENGYEVNWKKDWDKISVEFNLVGVELDIERASIGTTIFRSMIFPTEELYIYFLLRWS